MSEQIKVTETTRVKLESVHIIVVKERERHKPNKHSMSVNKVHSSKGARKYTVIRDNGIPDSQLSFLGFLFVMSKTLML